MARGSFRGATTKAVAAHNDMLAASPSSPERGGGEKDDGLELTEGGSGAVAVPEGQDYLRGTCEDPELTAAGYYVCGSNADREWHWHGPDRKWHDDHRSEDAAVRAALKDLRKSAAAKTGGVATPPLDRTVNSDDKPSTTEGVSEADIAWLEAVKSSALGGANGPTAARIDRILAALHTPRGEG